MLVLYNLNFEKLHLIVGAVTVFLFLLTGIYLKLNFPDIYSSNEIIRYQFRANHVYILMSGLVNLIAGLYIRPVYKDWRKIISVISLNTLILSPVLLIIAFFIEPLKASANRPLTFSGIIFLVIGVLFIFLPKMKFKK